MAVAFAQEAHIQATGNTASLTATFGVGVAVGSTLVLAVTAAAAGGSNTVSGCGATWTRKLVAVETATTANCELWIGTGTIASGTTVTVTPSNSTVFSIDVMEFTGVNSTTSASSQVNGSSTNAATPALTLSSGDAAYAFAAVHAGVTIGGASDTPSAWTAGATSTNGSLQVILQPAYFTGSTGTASHTATISGGSSTSVGESILLSATGGGGGGGGSMPKRPVIAGRAVTRAAVI